MPIREEIGSYDAKTRLPEILRRVEAGEAFTITNHGRPIADLVPSHRYRQSRTQQAVEQLLSTRKRVVSDETLATLRDSGRK